MFIVQLLSLYILTDIMYIIALRTTTHHLKSLNTQKKEHTDGNPCPCLEQAQKCGGLKPVYGIPTLPLDNWNTDIYRQ